MSVYSDTDNVTVNGVELPLLEAILGRMRLGLTLHKGLLGF